jgi:hypothetical protein
MFFLVVTDKQAVTSATVTSGINFLIRDGHPCQPAVKQEAMTGKNSGVNVFLDLQVDISARTRKSVPDRCQSLE